MASNIREIYPHLRALDSDSLEVAAWIHHVYPQWASFMTAQIWKNTAFLNLSVPAPVSHPMSQYDLRITTEDNLIVYFDQYHTHFDSYVSMAEAVTAAQIFIDDILHERRVVLVGLSHFAACYTPEMLEKEVRRWKASGESVAYTRSWRGTYNQIYDVE